VSQFISLLIGGAVAGAIYSILAMGLVLSYSTSRIFNFGQGATAFSCAYLYYELHSAEGWPLYLAAAFVVLVFAPLAGIVWDRLVFRHLAGAPEAPKIVATVGILLVMPALVLLVGSVLRNTFHLGFLDTSAVVQSPGIGPTPPVQWHPLSGVTINSDQLITLGVATFAFIALTVLLRYTRLGLTMRTAVDRPLLAELRGTDTDHVSSLAWRMSFVLAGAAGVLAGPITGFGLVSNNFTVALFVAATVAIFARLRSIPVAFFGGLVLGAANDFSQGYLNSKYLGSVGNWIQNTQGLQASLPYFVLLIGLVVLGVERGRRAGTSSEGRPPIDYLSDLTLWRRRLPWIIASIGFMAYALGPINPVWRQTCEIALATGLVFLSYTIVLGLGGMVSLAQTAFVTLAGLTAGYLMTQHGWPFIPSLLVGMAMAALAGALIALISLRLGGIAVALATLAFALLGFTVLFNLAWLDNTGQGWTISRPKLGFINLGNDRTFVIVLFLMVLLGVWLVKNLQGSAIGRAITAVRSSETAAASSGVSPTVAKLLVFTISAAFAGVGGIMLSVASGAVEGSQYPPNPLAFLWLATVVVFGVRRPALAIVAAISSVFFPAILNSGIHIGSIGWGGTTQTLFPQILFGGAAIALAQNPDGILADRARKRFLKRQAKRAKVETPQVAMTETVSPKQPLEAVQKITTNGVAGQSTPSTLAPDVEVAIKVTGLHAGYGQVEVLKGIDLSVPAASVLALLGPNGAGKSTFCSVLGGTVGVTSGTIEFMGEDITHLSAHERVERGIIVVPESRGIFPSVSVDDNLALWLRESEQREEVYERFPQLAARRRLAAGNLSGGEQQMLSIGPMLVKPPKLLVMDEPTLGIASIVSEVIMEKVAELTAQGTTVILVEEKARDVLTIAEWVGTLYRGSLLWLSPTSEVNQEALAHAYLGGEGGDEGRVGSGVITEVPQ